MTTIRETITSALTSAGVSEYSQQNYSTYIDAVETAVKEKMYDVADKLVESGVSMGANRGDVETVVQNAGLELRPAPEPEPEVADLEAMFAEDSADEDKLTAILTALRGIQETQSAQGEAIQKLNNLASSRLGVNL